MSNLRKSVLSWGQKKFAANANDYSPVKWSKYFVSQKDVFIGNNKFHVYTIGENGPLLVSIHGGGYSALTWSLFAEEIIHRIDCQLIAIDLRGHGSTITENDEDLSLETLAKDITDVLLTLYGESMPPIILVGHSLGGAVAVEAASLINAAGVCVIDVVEGTALESLSSMQSILRGRPSSFKTIDDAIQWSFRGGQTHNLEAARVSMPGQIKNVKTGVLAAEDAEIEKVIQIDGPPKQKKMVHQRSADAIDEEVEDEIKSSDQGSSHKLPPAISSNGNDNFRHPSTNNYVWRIDLSKTEPFWTGWFKGLSQKFLDIHSPKVLLLANIHGLDTSLTVGQMQGKFQLQVLPRSGHAIHEDQPHHVADIIAGFLVKQRLAEPRNGFTPHMPAC
ncbi:protein phosphatase methylesterase 1 [Agrilus planipennis]|uniref:Protein phosphatase methylesterase 1 n=1 Tax=Agrilus planipennis TaxID=224129 RepID=A0A1W4W9A7_AGRPL|nr:protein phosphatase methylesterase 1 [Agrilus planipennis]